MTLPNLFKITVLALALGSVAIAKGDDDEPYKLTDLGGGLKVVVFTDTVSHDKHYALGWTILPVDKKSRPADWSHWNADDPSSMGDYPTRDDENPKAPYEDVDCVVDLQRKTLLRLPANFPDYPHKNRGYFVASWGPEAKGARHAFVQIDARFYTTDLWMVTIDSKGMAQMQIVDQLGKRVEPVLSSKRPLSADEYGITFPVSSGDDGKGGVVYHEQTADIPFFAEIPKSMDENAQVTGTLTVRFSDGAVEKVWSDTVRDDPFADDAKLGKADAELNKTYAALLHSLPSAKADELKKEQRQWIWQRNRDASGAAADAGSDTDPDVNARNKSLLDSTQKRNAELNAQLKALKK